MRRQPRLIKHENSAYNPWEQRVDLRWRCNICGFAGIDPERFNESERAVFTVETTGTTYQPPAGTAVDQLGSVIDATTFNNVGAPGASCPFCGAARVFDGSAGDLLW